MSKYRIIKLKGYNSMYIAQKRVYLVFWVNLNSIDYSFTWCEYIINKRIKEESIKLNNPKSIKLKSIKLNNPKSIIIKEYV